MQNYGFIMMFILFIICYAAFPQLTGSAQGLRIFQFLYFFSSFWNQVGFSGSVLGGFGVLGVCGVSAQSGAAHLLFLYFFGSF